LIGWTRILKVAVEIVGVGDAALVVVVHVVVVVAGSDLVVRAKRGRLDRCGSRHHRGHADQQRKGFGKAENELHGQKKLVVRD